MTYLVKLRPLENYTLGTELGFTDENFHGAGRSSYIATSGEVPDQTTVLGMVRFMVLKNCGILRTDFCYSSQEKQKISELIGPESFDFTKPDQSFGVIRGISPVFIIKTEQKSGEEQYLVPTPAFLKENRDGTFSAIKMDDEHPVRTNGGKDICLPAEGEYDPKAGYPPAWYNLSEKRPEGGLFSHHFILHLIHPSAPTF